MYTTLEKVTSILSTSNGNKRVRTSSTALKELRAETVTNNFTDPINTRKTRPSALVVVNKSLITVSSEFTGNANIVVEFFSPTEYRIWSADSGNFLLNGTGTISTASSNTEGTITFEIGCFSGDIDDKTLVRLEFSAHISDDHVDEYILQTSHIVDNIVSDESVRFSTDGFELIYDEPSEQIKIATAYLCAFYIYTDVFADVQSDVAEKEFSYAFRWRKRAEEILTKYLRWQKRVGPTVFSFPAIVTQIGVEGIGSGPQLESEDPAIIQAGSGAENEIDPKVP